MMILVCTEQHLSKMKNLSSTEAELKESAAYKKNVYLSFDLVLI